MTRREGGVAEGMAVLSTCGDRKRKEVNTPLMHNVLNELSRAARVVPLEVRARWHAHRAARLHDLQTKHRTKLDACMVEARELAANR